MPTFQPPGSCPVCGEYVEEGQTACPNCGSCAQTGWSEESDYDGLDLPEEDLPSTGRSSGIGATQTLKGVAVAVLLALLIYVFVFW